MKESQSNSVALQLLPKRREGPATKCFNSKPSQFYSNIFEIRLKKDCMTIYQYCLDISPEIPADSDGLIDKISKTLYSQLKKHVGMICSRGLMIWGRKDMKTVLTCKAQFTRSEQKHSYEVLVKPTKQISLDSFLNENIQNLPSIIQVLNINAKKKLRDEKMVELTPGSYYQRETINNNKVEGKLNVWRGFDITVATYNKKIYLQVDPCSRVLRQESFLQTIEEERTKISLEQIIVKYKGSPILRRYGNPKIYRIEEIDYKQNPKCLFYFTKEGKEVSYIYYYKVEYGVEIKNQNQPLIKVSQMKKNHTMKEGFKEFIYLVPELVSLTGLTDQQRGDFKLMQNLAQFTKLTAAERMKQTKKMLNYLQDGKDELMFQINQTPRPLQGFKMPTPEIELGPNRYADVKPGTIFLKEKILDPFRFDDIYLCYSVGKYKQDDQADADDAYNLLQKAARTFGIYLSEKPYYLEVKYGNKLQDWTPVLLEERQSLTKSLKEWEDEKQRRKAKKEKQPKKPKADIFIFLMKPNEKELYGDLKKFITFQFNCPSQVATRRVLSSKSKSGLSAASKIVLQMNVKIGHSLWVVHNDHPIWKKCKVAISGIASSKGKGGISLGFTGTTNPQLTNYFSDCKIIKKKQDICVALFQNIYLLWLQNWFGRNEKQLPTVLIIYREGMNQTQAKIQSQFEIRGIIEAIETVRVKAKSPEYNPTIIYILVNKKPSSRIFEGEAKGKNIDFFNPSPGSVIFEDLSQGYKEFHLASAQVREGTCTPVSFKVAYQNRSDFPFEAICQLTYNQTYSYYNWTGSVRVPAPLQYANKLAKQYSDIGGELETQEKNSDLKSKLFFL